MINLFTIGHSNVSSERIIELLRQHGIEAVIDVRSTPYSRHNPQFNREKIQCMLEAIGIQYVYEGQDLGGRPNDPSCYEDGKVQYRLIMNKRWYQRGIERLIERAKRQRVAIMCSEEDPSLCHRHNLIAQTLLERSITVWHIRSDGRLEQASLKPHGAQQLSLF